MKTATEEKMVPAESFTIRRAGRDDVSSMSLLLQELFAIETEFEFDAQRQKDGLKMLLDSPMARIWVAERRGRLVGMVTMQLVISTAEGGYSGLLEDLVISRPYRRKGLGKALLKTALRWARKRGASRVQLLADSRNVQALVFYREQEWLQSNMIALRRKV